MRAAQVKALEGPDAVVIDEVPDPSPNEQNVLIETYAAGVTFPDVLMTRGEYQIKPSLPYIPGCEVAGVVVDAPTGGSLAPGDRVAAFSGLGGFAQRVSVNSTMVFPLPDRVSLRAGASLPMNYLTAHFALTKRGHLERGERVLVHGAAGGIGTATIQLAKVLGAQVIAVVSQPDKAEVARAAGAHEVVLADGFRQQVAELTSGEGVNMVVDPVGGDRFTDSLRSLATEGRLLVIGFTGGEIPTVKVNRLLLNNIDVVGVGWGSYWTRRPSYLQDQWRELLPPLKSGDLVPVLGPSFELDQAADAVKELDERRAVGKILVSVKDEPGSPGR